MQTINDNRNLKITSLTYVGVFFVIYITDTLLFATNAARLFLFAKRFGVVIVTMIMFFYKAFVKKDTVNLTVIFLSCSILCSAINANRIITGYSYYTMIACIWFGYLSSKNWSLEKFSHCYCRIMRIIAIVSLVGWLFASQITSIGAIPVVTNTVGYKYKTLILTAIPMITHHATRNMGPFWEPGAYQVYLNIALFFTLFVEQNRKKTFNVLLFVITCLSTLSGAALIPMLLMIAAYTFENKKVKSFVFSAVILSIILILFATGSFDVVIEKINRQDNTSSAIYRWIGIEGGIKGFLNNPIIGSTPEQNEQIKSELAMKYLGQKYASNTNTFINYFAYYGIFVGGFMLVRAYKLFRYNMTSTFAAWLCFTAFILTTSNENMMDSLMVVALLFLKSETENNVAVKEAPQ
jgi:hypothetical protein